MEEEIMREKPKIKEAPVSENVVEEIEQIDAGKIEAPKPVIAEHELSKWNKENLEIAKQLGEKKAEEPKHEIELDPEPPKFANPEKNLFAQLDDDLRPFPNAEIFKARHPELYEKEPESSAIPEAPPIMSGGLFEKLDDKMRLVHPWPPAVEKGEKAKEMLKQLEDAPVQNITRESGDVKVQRTVLPRGLEATVEKEAEKPVEEKLETDARTGKAVSGSYKIVGKIGEGSCGVLYKAIADITNKPVILKISSHKDIKKGDDQIIGEAIIHKRLRHPNISSIDAVVRDDENRVYAVMQEIEGAKKLDVSEKRSLKRIAQIAKTLAEAYDYAHKQGVLHRDIKPDNILIDKNGMPHIIDFGVAKITDKETIERLRNSLGETSFTDNGKAGTPKYMAPEILEGDAEPSPTTEVYSLGKVLYHMLLQTDKATPIGDVKKQLEEKIAKLVGVKNDYLSSKHNARTKLAETVAKATSDADNRYKSMQEFAKDLDAIISSLPDEIIDVVEPAKEVPKNNAGGFFISEDADYYHLHNVSLDGKLWDYSWTKKLLNNGKTDTQEEHVKRTKNEKNKLASLPVYNASITAVLKHRKNSSGKQKELADKVCQMFAGDFNNQFMMTSTNVAKAGEQHTVIHDYGYAAAEKISAKLGDGWITANCGLEKSTQALFKTQNFAEIEQTYKKLTGQKPYLLGFSLDSLNERAVVLGRNIYDNGFDIDCGGIYNGRPARGVVVEQKNLEEKVENNNEPAKREYHEIKFSTYRGSGLTRAEKVMKAAEYVTYINDILNAFGTCLKILHSNKIRLWKNVPLGTDYVETSQIQDLFEKYENFYELWEYTKNNYFDIQFMSEDEKIKGCVEFKTAREGIVVRITPNKIVDSRDTKLVESLKYFAKTQTGFDGISPKAIWFSPKKKLEKQGFTLEYAIDLFDNNKFRSSELKFVKGKKLYDVEGRCYGYASTCDQIYRSPSDNVAGIYFKQGRIFKREIKRYSNNAIIDIGDRYLLKP